VVKTGIRDEGERETETGLDIDIRRTGNLVLVDLVIAHQVLEEIRGERSVSDLRTQD
jgi:hypothetical protein